jgi:DNA-binding CsgD family transcriptional regulator
MTRLLFCGEDQAFTLLEDPAPAGELAAAINAGRCRLAFPPGNGPWQATCQGSLVIVTPLGPPIEPLAAILPSPSPRQRQVLQLLAEGQPPKEIAFYLRVSMRTVTNHIRGLMVKLQAQTSQQLVARAVALGLYSPTLPE